MLQAKMFFKDGTCSNDVLLNENIMISEDDPIIKTCVKYFFIETVEKEGLFVVWGNGVLKSINFKDKK